MTFTAGTPLRARAETGRQRSVLIVINALGLAGAERVTVDLAVGLARRGDRVTLCCVYGTLVPWPELDEPGVELVELGAATRREKAFAVRRLMQLARASDVVLCVQWDASLWGRIAAIAAGRPVVVAEHSGAREFEKSRSGKPRARWIAAHHRLLSPFTPATVAVAGPQVDVLAAEGVDRRRIVHIPNAVSVEHLHEQASDGVSRADIGVPDEARLLIHLARFHPLKNQRATVDVTARLRERLGEVHVLFVGKGVELEAVKAYAREAGAGSWAHFLEARADVPRLLSLTDLFVLPSLGEAMPMSILEAIALEIPVVANDVGDIRAMVEVTGAGLVVPPADPDAFFDACLKVLGDEEMRTRLVECARDAAPEIDLGGMVDAYSDVLDHALVARRASGRS